MGEDGNYKVVPKNDTSNLGLTDYDNFANNNNIKMNFNPNTFDNIEPKIHHLISIQYNDDEKRKSGHDLKTNTVIT